MMCTMRPALAALGGPGSSFAGPLLGEAPAFCTPPDVAWGLLAPRRPHTRRYTIPQRRISRSPRSSPSPLCSSSSPSRASSPPPPPRPLPTEQISVYIRLCPRPHEPVPDDVDSVECSQAHNLIFSLSVCESRIAATFKNLKAPPKIMRPPRRRRPFAAYDSRATFLEEFDSLRDPSCYIANLVIAPGRTPSVEEIMRMGLIGRRKPAAEKLLLPPVRPQDAKKKCLIIDLDETLVHSSFKPVKNPDFVIPVEIDGVVHQVYVLKRPYVDEFLAHVGDKYECVLFTASLAKYADPVADLLDKRGVFRARLFREACVFHKGNYVKDLARLGRDLNKVLIMDNSPASYAFHPDNAIACQTWFDDPHDVELLDVLPLLDRLAAVDSVYSVLRQSESPEPRSDRSAS